MASTAKRLTVLVGGGLLVLVGIVLLVLPGPGLLLVLGGLLVLSTEFPAVDTLHRPDPAPGDGGRRAERRRHRCG